MASRKRQRTESNSPETVDSHGSDSESDSEGSGSNSTSSSSSSPDPADLSRQERLVMNFSFNQLMSQDCDPGAADAYQRNGKSPARVKRALASKCCAARCKRDLKMRALMALITTFWALTKPAQDSVLWSLQHPVWTPGEAQGSSSDSDSDDSDSDSSGSGSCASSSASKQGRGKMFWHIHGCWVVNI